MPHRIEVFTGDCPLCRQALDAVEAGKCGSCELIERNLARDFTANADAAARYGVRAVPTIVIDGRIRVEGKPEFPWVCSDAFYQMLERRYPILHSLE
ncbi:MAG TPA: thioredoxin family protein [Thermoplasmata archaeon]|nr:thioredoxin family protein [Thermoplasmata archaeon]